MHKERCIQHKTNKKHANNYTMHLVIGENQRILRKCTLQEVIVTVKSQFIFILRELNTMTILLYDLFRLELFAIHTQNRSVEIHV